MKKISLTALLLFCNLFASFAQSNQDSSLYQKHKITFEEANIVSSYYHQEGVNAAVNGGRGSEKLTDISNTIDLKIFRYDKQFRKHSLALDIGIDHYTSASSDMIDLRANSSASSADTRVYPSVNWTMENLKKATTIGAGAALSREFDYLSYSSNINFAVKSKNRSAEFAASFHAYLDQVSLILPVELRTGSSGWDDDYPTSGRKTFDLSLSYAQIINQRLQVMLLGDIVTQSGYLSLPFHRVYTSDGLVHQEKLPDTRLKIPLGFRANYFLADKLILRTYYRYYFDDWGLKSHTFNIEVPVKITPFVSLSPYYRYYIQSSADYFAAYMQHRPSEDFYTSNYDLASFTSHFYGMGIRLTPPKGILGIEHVNMLELRYGHYTKNVGMTSNIISLNIKFK